MKRLSYILSLLVVLSMLLAACAPAASEVDPAEMKGTLNVWAFTNEIRTMAIAFEARYPEVDVVYTMIPMTNGEYQTKVKAAAGTADSPDVVALEAAFVKEWVESDLLADLNELVPLPTRQLLKSAHMKVLRRAFPIKPHPVRSSIAAALPRNALERMILLKSRQWSPIWTNSLRLLPRSRNAVLAITSPLVLLVKCSTPSSPTVNNPGSLTTPSSLTRWLKNMSSSPS